MNETVAKEASELFKGMNLSQAQAQSLVDFYAAKNREAAEAPVNFWKEKQKEWKAEVQADPEIGGKLDQVRVSVARMIDGIGNPALASEFRQAMDYTGAGNNPAFVKFMFAMSQKLGEGRPVAGKGPVEVKTPTGAPPSIAQAMYPKLG